MSVPKYTRVAAIIRGQIADGTLLPGQPVPSGRRCRARPDTPPLALHDAYRFVSVPSSPDSCVEGSSVTEVYPPGTPARSEGATPANWPRGLPVLPGF